MSSAHHVHVYFRDAHERSHALALREAVAARFPRARLGRVHEQPVAFHRAPMFQVHLDAVPLGTLIPWLQRHRAGLSLMVHPLYGDVVRAHLVDAIWLGTPLSFDEERLRRVPPTQSAPSAAPTPHQPPTARPPPSARSCASTPAPATPAPTAAPSPTPCSRD